MIIAGASPEETKMLVAVRENGDFFALAVRITGKLFKIWAHAARGLASTEFPQGKQKMKAGVRKNDDFLKLCFE